MGPLIIGQTTAQVIWGAITFGIYVAFVRYNWAFLAPRDRYINSPLKLFLMRWLGNIGGAVIIGFVTTYVLFEVIKEYGGNWVQIDSKNAEEFKPPQASTRERGLTDALVVRELFESAHLTTRQALQINLDEKGYPARPVDGEWSPAT